MNKELINILRNKKIDNYSDLSTSWLKIGLWPVKRRKMNDNVKCVDTDVCVYRLNWDWGRKCTLKWNPNFAATAAAAAEQEQMRREKERA